MKRRHMLCFLGLLCLCALLGAGAHASQVPPETDAALFAYVVENQEVELTGYLGDEAQVIIPQTLEGRPVTAVGENAFLNNASVRTLQLPNTVTRIGRSAFEGMAALEHVTLPSKLTRLGDYAFKDCAALSSVELPPLLETIGYGAFLRCASLQAVVIPPGVTRIGTRAFDHCTRLVDVTIPVSVTTIGGRAFRNTPWLDAQTDDFVIINDAILIKYNGLDFVVDVPAEVTGISGAFDDCSWIEAIYLPEGLAVIGDYAFAGCIGLESIDLPQSIQALGSFAFQKCRSLSQISIPPGVTKLSEGVFSGCVSLEGVALPSTLTTISGRAFEDCTALGTIQLPYSLSTISDSAFEGCSVERLIISAAKGSEAEAFALRMAWKTESGILVESDFIYALSDGGDASIIGYMGDRVVLEIPDTLGGAPVVHIERDAFTGNEIIRAITLPGSMLSIGDRAFTGCDALQEVILFDGLSAIGERAYADCTALRSVFIPPSVEEIGRDAFAGCESLVMTIDDGSYAQTYAQSYDIPVVSLENSLDDFLLALDGADSIILAGYTGTRRALTLPKKQHGIAIETVGEGAFAGKPGIMVVHVPDGYIKVRSRAFADIDRELTVSLPRSVTHISPDAFENTNITLQGYPGSMAETFAREYGIKFLVQR